MKRAIIILVALALAACAGVAIPNILEPNTTLPLAVESEPVATRPIPRTMGLMFDTNIMP